jgi:hypothetical protein
MNLKRKEVNFYPNEMLDQMFFQRGFVLEGGGTLGTGEHVINMNLKRKKVDHNEMLDHVFFSARFYFNMNLKRKKPIF